MSGSTTYGEKLLRAEPRTCFRQAQLAQLAYDDAADPPTVHEFWTHERGSTAFGQGAMLRVIGRSCQTDGFDSTLELAFRGSQNVENWLMNFAATLVIFDLPRGRGRVHAGFQLAYKELRSDILRRASAMPRQTLVLVTGHSLGGALAMLAAFDLAGALPDAEVRCVTWGAPRVGDRDFAECYISRVPLTAHFVNKFDPVPHLPPTPDDQGLVSEVLKSVLGGTLRSIDGSEFMHTCVVTQLDADLESSLAFATAVVQELAVFRSTTRSKSSRGDRRQTLLPHSMDEYVKNLAARLRRTSSTRAGKDTSEFLLPLQRRRSSL